MKVLIAGGRGFLGRALTESLHADGHQVLVLTRRSPQSPDEVLWDGRTARGWGSLVNEVTAVVNLTGHSLNHWPWTKSQKRKFQASRVLPGRALAAGIESASHHPAVFVQTSGINYYGLSGEGPADESTPAAGDFLARLVFDTEAASEPVERMGVRRVITRNAVVLSTKAGLLPLMALPARLFIGGRHGNGKQPVPWIHLADYVGAVRFLMENPQARGAYNLIAPALSSNADFMRGLARALHRPFWFPAPAFLLRAGLGEMSVLLLEGRFARPRRLQELGYEFRFSNLETAFEDLF
jgi:uncharacterized protein (TIGR01777 family)